MGCKIVENIAEDEKEEKEIKEFMATIEMPILERVKEEHPDMECICIRLFPMPEILGIAAGVWAIPKDYYSIKETIAKWFLWRHKEVKGEIEFEEVGEIKI